MARKLWAVLAAAALLVICLCPAAAAQDTGWRVEIPIKGLPERLDKTDSGRTVDLLALADGGYTLSLTPLRMGKESLVRAVLTKGEGFLGLCLLCTRQEFGALGGLAVEIETQGRLCFIAMPEKTLLACLELPVGLAGECRLLPVAQSQGVTIAPLDAAPREFTQPVQPEETQSAQPADASPPPLRLHPGAYLLALLILAAALAALVVCTMRQRELAALARRAKDTASALRLELRAYLHTAKKKQKKEKSVDVPLPALHTQEIPRLAAGPHLPGLRVMAAENSALMKQIPMRAAWEESEPPIQDMSARMNEFYLGRAALPEAGRFLTVGLRNRDALQQLGGNSVRPLFAPNPRGQIFSLEEETGGLYLHADYFAPPSFVLQSVLRSVCLECVFALENAGGAPLRLENVLNHTILGIEPALTTRTESGFIVTQKGRLIVGEN